MDFHYVAPIRVRDGLPLRRPNPDKRWTSTTSPHLDPLSILAWPTRSGTPVQDPGAGARSRSPILKSTLQIQHSDSFELSLCSNIHNDSMCHRHAVPNSGAERRGHDRTGNQDTKVCGGGLVVWIGSGNLLTIFWCFCFRLPSPGVGFRRVWWWLAGLSAKRGTCKTLAQYFYPRRARAYPPLSRCRR